MIKNIIISALIVTSLALGSIAFSQHSQVVDLRNALVLGGNDNFVDFVQSTVYIVGRGWATRVASQNLGRSYLAITNMSGATSTANVIFCTASKSISAATSTNTSLFGAFPVGNQTFQGLGIVASSTYTFSKATGIPTAAIYCINPSASSTVGIVES